MQARVREIHFVTGKGGVGKSLYAAALAAKKADEGQKTLLVELGSRSYFSLFFGLDSIGYEPRSLRKNFDLALWSGPECLKEYVRYLLKIEALYKLFFENSVSRTLIRAAPALPELAVLGKITSGPRKHGPPMDYDVIVVDAFATGHFLALLRAPRALAQVISFGPMGEQSRSIDEHLFLKKLCHYHVVTLAEELPVQETLELCTQLQSEFGVQAQVIINKVMKTFLKSADLKPTSDKRISFVQFLKKQIENFEWAQAQLGSLKGKLQTVEFVTENRPWNLVDTIKLSLP